MQHIPDFDAILNCVSRIAAASCLFSHGGCCCHKTTCQYSNDHNSVCMKAPQLSTERSDASTQGAFIHPVTVPSDSAVHTVTATLKLSICKGPAYPLLVSTFVIHLLTRLLQQYSQLSIVIDYYQLHIEHSTSRLIMLNLATKAAAMHAPTKDEP